MAEKTYACLKSTAQVCQWVPSPLLGINHDWSIKAEHNSFFANKICGQMRQEKNPPYFLSLNALVCMLVGGVVGAAVDGDCIFCNSSSHHLRMKRKSRWAHGKQPRAWYYCITEPTLDPHTFRRLVVWENWTCIFLAILAKYPFTCSQK